MGGGPLQPASPLPASCNLGCTESYARPMQPPPRPSELLARLHSSPHQCREACECRGARVRCALGQRSGDRQRERDVSSQAATEAANVINVTWGANVSIGEGIVSVGGSVRAGMCGDVVAILVSDLASSRAGAENAANPRRMQECGRARRSRRRKDCENCEIVRLFTTRQL